jgi:hypothetical protein
VGKIPGCLEGNGVGLYVPSVSVFARTNTNFHATPSLDASRDVFHATTSLVARRDDVFHATTSVVARGDGVFHATISVVARRDDVFHTAMSVISRRDAFHVTIALFSRRDNGFGSFKTRNSLLNFLDRIHCPPNLWLMRPRAPM